MKWSTHGLSATGGKGVNKVTGQARYGADIRLPGMLYGKVLRRRRAHRTGGASCHERERRRWSAW
jgi:CO/xanthine dehydrogenase Mo-binding subunit